MTLLRTCALVGLAALLPWSASVARAATAAFAFPGTSSVDKWMYGNVSGPAGGQVDVAPVFAFLNSDDEDRLAGLLVAFQTSSLIPASLDPSQYQITSIKLRVWVLTADTFFYDPSHDGYRTYLPAQHADFQPDADEGRPVELFGAGLRNGYTSLTTSTMNIPGAFGEMSPFQTSGEPILPNAFPVGQDQSGVAYDISDNVSDGREANPFAIGRNESVDAGELFPAETELTFNLDVSNPFVLNYVREGLASGTLGLFISSLHGAAGQVGPQTYPRLYTREGATNAGAPEFAPRLEVEFAIVPEPQLSGLLIIGIALLTAGRALRHRNHLS